MMIQSTNAAETGMDEEAVRALSKAKKEPEWLLQQRLTSLKAFEELQLPQLSYGLSVNSSVTLNIAELRPLETITHHNNSSSENGVITEDLSVAASKYEDVLRPLMTSNDFRHKLDALHSAFWNSGIFVYAPKKKSEEHVSLQLQQNQTEIVAIVVVAEENANIVITESLTETATAATDCKAYRFEGVDIKAAPNSTVKFATLQKLGSNVNSVIVRKALAEKDATVDWVDISIGGGSTRQETVTALNGEGAASTITGAFFGDGSQQLDIMAKEVHNARNTRSSIRIKGALQGKAKAIVQSFTKIMKTAANSEGHQKANVLLLSDTARASPIPKLEIDNYDVKASHEASVGQLDSEKLFYLMSRGLSSREAVTLVVEGFFEPLLKGLPVAELANDMRETIHNKLDI